MIEPDYNAEKYGVTLSDLKKILKGESVYAVCPQTYTHVEVLDLKHGRIEVEADAINYGEETTFYHERDARGKTVLHNNSDGSIMLKLSRGLITDLKKKLKLATTLFNTYENENEKEKTKKEKETKKKKKKKKEKMKKEKMDIMIKVDKMTKKQKQEVVMDFMEMKKRNKEMEMEMEMAMDFMEKTKKQKKEMAMDKKTKKEIGTKKKQKKDVNSSRINPRTKMRQIWKEVCYYRWVNE
jgi:hypothetical protein